MLITIIIILLISIERVCPPGLLLLLPSRAKHRNRSWRHKISELRSSQYRNTLTGERKYTPQRAKRHKTKMKRNTNSEMKHRLILRCGWVFCIRYCTCSWVICLNPLTHLNMYFICRKQEKNTLHSVDNSKNSFLGTGTHRIFLPGFCTIWYVCPNWG